jgi:TatD DNase family protein
MEWNANTLVVIKRLVSLPEVVAVGEVGLDFHRNYSKQEIQIEAFEKQVSHQNIFILEMS